MYFPMYFNRSAVNLARKFCSMKTSSSTIQREHFTFWTVCDVILAKADSSLMTLYVCVFNSCCICLLSFKNGERYRRFLVLGDLRVWMHLKRLIERKSSEHSHIVLLIESADHIWRRREALKPDMIRGLDKKNDMRMLRCCLLNLV